jgi:hypothetical protein
MTPCVVHARRYALNVDTWTWYAYCPDCGKTMTSPLQMGFDLGHEEHSWIFTCQDCGAPCRDDLCTSCVQIRIDSTGAADHVHAAR